MVSYSFVDQITTNAMTSGGQQSHHIYILHPRNVIGVFLYDFIIALNVTTRLFTHHVRSVWGDKVTDRNATYLTHDVPVFAIREND